MRVIGVVLLAIGALWIFQGIGVVGGSFMSGDALWAVIGLVTAGAGFVLLARSGAGRQP